ncbi:MAG: insulinase family protein [Alphaproteobacteria bacterium]|nr:insulinase family protein [Alphaproteobacteria bacterium]
MRKLLFFFIFLIFAANADFKADEFSLKNGMKVIMIEKKSVPIISLSVWYKCGSKCDMLSKSGAAHFLEHLACENHKRVFSDYLEEIGAENNAFTFFNTICFYEIFPSDCFEKVLSFESERMKSLEIEDKVFQNEKKAILEERGMRVDADVQGRYGEVFLSNIFNRQIGGIEVIGWKHEIESIEIEDLQAFYKKWITPNNAILILVGDFEKKSAKELIEKYFGTVSRGDSPKISSLNNKEFNKKLIECRSTENGPSSAITYVLKVPFSPKNNLRKSLALSLALEILEQPSSFTETILKQMSNIISTVNFSYTDSVYQFDILDITFHATSIDNLDKVEIAWPYLKKKILADCISENDLKKIKRRRLISLAYKREDIQHIAEYFGWNLMFRLPVKEILSLDNMVQSITVKECNDVLQEIFSTSPISVMKTFPKGYDRD